MAKLHTSVAAPLRKPVVISLFVIFIGLSSCGAAKVGSRSYEYGFIGGNRLSNPNSEERNTNSEVKERLSSVAAVVVDENSLPNTNESSGDQTKQLYTITVYPWNNHLGRPAIMEWSVEEEKSDMCKEVPTRWQGKVRSVNTYDNCVVLFNRANCKGISRIVKKGSPSHNRLSDICFQRKPMSARPCTEEEHHPPSTNEA
ncbi:hypothetical protein Ocin01_01320 [Orchesella cincta]|uniref:Uncharacterized protein n=1 Tax=Orchesella cincta TaxID=48709 RepID=A0A1D2NJI2_ORCCI|nr:hypothetical protein Ocin01_01320 [Orchesella cincta]